MYDDICHAVDIIEERSCAGCWIGGYTPARCPVACLAAQKMYRLLDRLDQINNAKARLKP